VVGASSRQLMGLLGSEFFRLVCLAALIALPLAGYLGHIWLRSFAYASDLTLWYLPAAFLIVQGLCLLAISLAALRAVRVNPAESLRED
jgi:putative ABC transport system permease protein